MRLQDLIFVFSLSFILSVKCISTNKPKVLASLVNYILSVICIFIAKSL